jgi:hypothetical protein
MALIDVIWSLDYRNDCFDFLEGHELFLEKSSNEIPNRMKNLFGN